MIDELLPAAAACTEAFADDGEPRLFAQERAVLGRAVAKRRREFATGRECAHRALEQLGLMAEAVPSGERGEPLWPAGVVVSITHCDGYRLCGRPRERVADDRDRRGDRARESCEPQPSRSRSRGKAVTNRSAAER